MLGGVCAGLARRFDVDPLVVRVGAVVLAIGTSGFAAVLYLLAWGLFPASGDPADAPRRRRGRRGSWRIAAGSAMLALSVLLAFRAAGHLVERRAGLAAHAGQLRRCPALGPDPPARRRGRGG